MKVIAIQEKLPTCWHRRVLIVWEFQETVRGHILNRRISACNDHIVAIKTRKSVSICCHLVLAASSRRHATPLAISMGHFMN